MCESQKSCQFFNCMCADCDKLLSVHQRVFQQAINKAPRIRNGGNSKAVGLAYYDQSQNGFNTHTKRLLGGACFFIVRR